MTTQFAPSQKMVFLDLETTGLAPSAPGAAILEIAMVVVEVPRFVEVDHFSVPVARLPGLKVDHGCDEYVTKMHTESGLFADILAHGVQRQQAEDLAVAFYNRHCSGTSSYLGGSNPDFDRRWLDVWMTTLSRKLHYRNFDVNSLFILREYLTGRVKGNAKHRALDDCRQAIAGVHAHFTYMRQLFGAPGWVERAGSPK
jgi:oligoribonuclease